ncbi:putative zinc protease [Pilimelia terevasa]|uniref:Putative zinc protease n=1 Tax=Pilimelia terevasa TaxID=53372 RepID=A0A8J3BLE2_9ACTN|nr:pitrilysin family protein [Pilimelia terevasa]GGK27702.1 putative zinc protease [Pilimelia terevasa]
MTISRHEVPVRAGRREAPARAGSGTSHAHAGGAAVLDGTVRRTVLPQGLRIVTEAIPAMRSACFGVWVAAGSRDEAPADSGVSHFLEHLLFKGTRTRTALEISAQIEAVGGETNAFTAKEYTCFYARVLDADLPMAIEVMCDLVADSLLTAEDVETERGVILEEIAMHDDEPGDEVHDLLVGALYDGHPLGRLISGTEESITAMTRGQILDFYARHYTAPQIVIAAAGSLDHDRVVAQVSAALAGTPLGDGAAPAAPAGHRPPTPVVATAASSVVVQRKDTEQAHLVLGVPGIGRLDDRRFALGVLNNVLGGGMSSRLFQEIRERRGLAYSVYSYASQFADTGYFAVYAGCAPGRAAEVRALIAAELDRVRAEGITDDELTRGKGMLKGTLVLGLEDTGSRMTRLAKGELLYDEQLSVDDLLARVDTVTSAQVTAVAGELLRQPASLAVVGPFADGDFAPRP